MSKQTEKVLPCAGTSVGDGCGVFERYFENELMYTSSHAEPDQQVVTLSPQELLQLREKLHQDFIDQGFCVLARERSEELPEGVVRLFGESDITFSGCIVAISERQNRAQLSRVESQ